jgi:Tol biopolymer transport system component
LVTEGSAVLRWTASGDDGMSGQARGYDIRYAEAPITLGTWSNATYVPGPTPRMSGNRELLTVPGLQSGTTYYFALIVMDDVENRSELSNAASATISVPIQVTHYTYSALDPDWSPDGQSIIYNSQAEIQPGITRSELFVIPASGGGPVRYTSSPDGATQASWSSDGTKIAFRLYVDGNRKVLGVMNAQPEAQPQVVADHLAEAVSGPRWSPDGTRIAYVVTGGGFGQPAGSVMYTVPSSGGAPERLAGDYTWVVSGLDWSPDGTQIAYSSNQTGKHHIFVMARTGGVPSQLTNGSGNESTPAWSPDGSKIAYVVDQPQEIRIVYATGENPTRVTFDPINLPYRKITWSPDGAMIAYGATATNNEITNLWMLRLK